ncbi:hypothetical protein B0E43_08440 [Algoriphagus sp. A40]|nr:hypothetical protein B0E43_08440 [Algoriphagus sp. A40]
MLKELLRGAKLKKYLLAISIYELWKFTLIPEIKTPVRFWKSDRCLFKSFSEKKPKSYRIGLF